MAQKLRKRVPDTMVALIALALIVTPFVAVSEASLVDVPITVDQKVHETAMVSKPLQGNFDVSNTGKSVGKLNWDVYTSAGEGFKLTVATDAVPALRDTVTGAKVTDYASSLSDWNVGSSDRRFGLSAEGERVLAAYGQGSKWRGFEGTRGIEVARRRTGPARMTRTTLWLASEMRSPLPAIAAPNAYITATASVNL